MTAAPRSPSLLRDGLVFAAGVVVAVLVMQLWPMGVTDSAGPSSGTRSGNPNALAANATGGGTGSAEDTAKGDPLSRLREAMANADRDSRMEKLRHLAEELAEIDPTRALEI